MVRGGGGKKELASASLFSELVVVVRVTPLVSLIVREGIRAREPSVAALVAYLFAVQMSFSEAFSNQFSQWFFLESSISFAYSLPVSRCSWWDGWSGRPLHRYAMFANLFFFFLSVVSCGFHHRLVWGKGFVMGTFASIEALTAWLS